MLCGSDSSCVKAISWASFRNSTCCKQIASIGQVPSPSLLLFPCKEQEFQSMSAVLWPVGLTIFVKSVWDLFYHYFQSNPHLGCTISVGQFSSKSQQSFSDRVQMLICEKSWRFGIYFSLTALIHLYKAFPWKSDLSHLNWRVCLLCHSTQGTWIWGCNLESTGISLCLSVDLNELWIRLSKAFGVSGIQGPLLSHGYNHGLSMSLAQRIWKLRMEDGIDFKQSWYPAFLSYVYSPSFYLSPSEVKSRWFTCFSVFSFSKACV